MVSKLDGRIGITKSLKLFFLVIIVFISDVDLSLKPRDYTCT